MTSKPLWQQFYEMTEKQAQEVQAEDLRRIRSGEMSPHEAEERARAWRRASEQQLREAETQFELCKLARATGCPDQTPVIPWLLERGLVVEHPDGGYVMTAKAGPRAAAPNK